VQIMAHSARTFLTPRNRNWRNPRACLICPNAGSTTCFRNHAAEIERQEGYPGRRDGEPRHFRVMEAEEQRQHCDVAAYRP
jgi:hypothetical protein